MLLSLYASFRWAGKSYYALKMSAFIIVSALLSTGFLLLAWMFAFILFPLHYVSFPFFSDGLMGSPVNPRIIFLTIDILSLPEGAAYSYAAFLFFTAVNSLGALLGFGLSKIQKVQEIVSGKSGLWILLAPSVVILGVGLPLTALGYPYVSFIMFGVIWLAAIIVEMNW